MEGSHLLQFTPPLIRYEAEVTYWGHVFKLRSTRCLRLETLPVQCNEIPFNKIDMIAIFDSANKTAEALVPKYRNGRLRRRCKWHRSDRLGWKCGKDLLHLCRAVKDAQKNVEELAKQVESFLKPSKFFE